MLQTAPDAKSPPDKFAIDIMLAAMAGAIRSLLEAEPSPATVRKSREQFVLLCQSDMVAATAKRLESELSGAHIKVVHRECANGEFLDASLQNSQTSDGHCTHRDCPDRRRA
jgi:hypothetical protein